MNKTKLAVEVFDKLANLYQEKYMYLDLYNASYDSFCNLLPEHAQILELACGPGNITKYLLKNRPDFKILSTDLSPKMLELAKINNPTAEFMLMDSRNVNSLDQKFDGIVCGFCLPYLSKEESIQLIVDAANVLNENGTLYLSTMEDDYSKSGMKSSSTGEEIYMYYHEANYLTEALISNGFEIINLTHQASPVSEGSQALDTDLIIIAQKIK